MKKVFKKIAAVALAGLLGATGLAAFAGCSDPYENMTTISIHYYKGGLGDDWINESISDFEEMFKDVSFEPGKTGVHISLTSDKLFDGFIEKLSQGNEKADILYTAEGNDIVDLLNADGVAYDTTGIATEKVYDANGEVTLNATGDGFVVQENGSSMYDRMHSYHRDVYNLADTEWATNESEVSFTLLPYEDTLAGIIIDYDLYVELYNKAHNAGKIGNMTGYKYEGDEVAMPGTWDEFFEFMVWLRDEQDHNAGGYSGFIFGVDYYTAAIENAIIADVDGTDEGVEDPNEYSGFRMYDTFTGKYDFDGDGVKETTITNENHELLTQTRGYEKAVEVALRLFESGGAGKEHYDNQIVGSSTTYSTAQANFVMSKTSNTNPRILAILEGDWFENEARATFNSMGAANEENAYGKRRFRIMPIPHATDEEVEEGKTYKVGGFSGGYPLVVNAKTVSGNIAKEKLVKLWLQFTHSDSQLNVFTKWSGSVRPYNYDITEATKNEMTPFAQSVLELQMEDRKADGKIEIVRRNNIAKSNTVRNTASPVNFSTKITEGTFNNAAVIPNMQAMRKQNISWTGETQIAAMLEKYMEGMLTARTPD